VVLFVLQGKGRALDLGYGVGKEAFLLQAFLDTFVATKVSGPRAAKSATM